MQCVTWKAGITISMISIRKNLHPLCLKLPVPWQACHLFLPGAHLCVRHIPDHDFNAMLILSSLFNTPPSSPSIILLLVLIQRVPHLSKLPTQVAETNVWIIRLLIVDEKKEKAFPPEAWLASPG